MPPLRRLLSLRRRRLRLWLGRRFRSRRRRGCILARSALPPPTRLGLAADRVRRRLLDRTRARARHARPPRYPSPPRRHRLRSPVPVSMSGSHRPTSLDGRVLGTPGLRPRSIRHRRSPASTTTTSFRSRRPSPITSPSLLPSSPPRRSIPVPLSLLLLPLYALLALSLLLALARRRSPSTLPFPRCLCHSCPPVSIPASTPRCSRAASSRSSRRNSSPRKSRRSTSVASRRRAMLGRPRSRSCRRARGRHPALQARIRDRNLPLLP